MKTNDIKTVIAQFIDKHLAANPNLNGWQKFVGGGSIALFLVAYDEWIAAHNIGIVLDKDGNVDISKVEAFLVGGIERSSGFTVSLAFPKIVNVSKAEKEGCVTIHFPVLGAFDLDKTELADFVQMLRDFDKQNPATA